MEYPLHLPYMWMYTVMCMSHVRHVGRKRRAHQRRGLDTLLGNLCWRPLRYWDAFLLKAAQLRHWA